MQASSKEPSKIKSEASPTTKTADIASLNQQIKTQGEKVRDLKAKKAEKVLTFIFFIVSKFFLFKEFFTDTNR